MVALLIAAATNLFTYWNSDRMVLRMYGGEPGRSSVMTWYELGVEGDERIYAEGSSKVVWMDNRSGKSSPLPDVLRAHVA